MGISQEGHANGRVGLTEDASPPARQAEAVDGGVVDGDPGQREDAALARVPGVRVQGQADDEEADHGEDDRDHQRHLGGGRSAGEDRLLGWGGEATTKTRPTLKGLGWRGKR